MAAPLRQEHRSASAVATVKSCDWGVNKDGVVIYIRNSSPFPSNLAENAPSFSKNRNFERLSPGQMLLSGFRSSEARPPAATTEVPPYFAKKSFLSRRERGQIAVDQRGSRGTLRCPGVWGDEGI